MKTQQQVGAGEEILHPTNRKLFQNWDMIRRNKDAPSRKDINLRALKKILGHVAILEAAPDAHIMRYRLAGTQLRKIFCKELTGTDLLTQWTPKDRVAIEAMLRMSLQESQPVTVRFVVQPASGHTETIEAVFLPLAEQDQLLASYAAFSDPYWLGEQAIVKQNILSIRTVNTKRSHPMRRSKDHSADASPVVLVATQDTREGRAFWPGFRVIPGGRK
ncbi:MAG: PAS domain-containing protein [Hyphomicrobiales bacterium]